MTKVQGLGMAATVQHAIVVGGGPAGLMAAEVLSSRGVQVDLYDAMPSVGRKFLLAGKGGLNLTHSEPLDRFVTRYGARQSEVSALLHGFEPEALRAWAQGLGVSTFVGTSGRVFPTDMKAAPMLRAWLQRLRHPAQGPGVRFHMRHRWLGWQGDGALSFETPQGGMTRARSGDVPVVLALGGASWARLGSDGAWVPLLRQQGVDVQPLLPANCGFDVQGGWTEHFSSRFAGQPFKSVAIRLEGGGGQVFSRQGEFVATATGVEGSLIYAASSLLRDQITSQGAATLHLDLLPQFTADRVLAEVMHPRGSRSLSAHLKSRLGLEGIKSAILHEVLGREGVQSGPALAAAIKALPLVLTATRPLDEAISTAGGVAFEALGPQSALKAMPGVFCAGEMLDWEAPTGGYLLTACMASGKKAGEGAWELLRSM
ncbi:MAG: hypothetical protein RJA34_187 [Pseudomonadota bacterium]|jgi:uncharacterized flavoprotein (TIGR03862 family)